MNRSLSNSIKLYVAVNKTIKYKNRSDITGNYNYEGLRDKGLKWRFNTMHGGIFSLDEDFEKHADKLYEDFNRHGQTMY